MNGKRRRLARRRRLQHGCATRRIAAGDAAELERKRARCRRLSEWLDQQVGGDANDREFITTVAERNRLALEIAEAERER